MIEHHACARSICRFGRFAASPCVWIFLVAVAALPGPAHAQNSAPSITSPSTFSVVEGNTAVATLTATDADSDPLTWSLADPAGDDGALFTLSEAGDLSFVQAPDYENAVDANTDNVYEVTVQVSDDTASTTADLEVTVSDVSPGLAGPATASHAEGKRGLRIAAYSADDDVTWTLAGADSTLFMIAGGFLRFVDPPDFEDPADTGTDNVYNVIVLANDGTAIETTAVAVTVTNVDEPGVVTFSSLKPKLGTALTATLADPDTVTGTPTWQWERNDGREGWKTIDGATSASYTPTTADGDRYLRVSATYTDSFGSGKTAQAMVPHVVIAHRLSALTVSGLSGVSFDDRAFYPAFDPDTLHYAARCTASVSLTLTTEDTDTRLAVNGVQRPKGEAFTVDGLGRESDIRITLTGAGGASTTYTVHCIDRQEFPKLTTVKADGATEDLMMFGRTTRYLIMMDNNGVPRWHKWIGGPIGAYFRVFPDETHPRARYAFIKGATNGGIGLVALDKYFNTVDEDIQILSPFNSTDGHDQMILPNGDYVLLAYSRGQRDLGFLNTAFPDLRNADGDPLGTNEAVRDSAIQVRKADGTVLFNWNSWDHMAIEDCITGSEFRDEYGHINSVGLIDGDIIAGFRPCSKILRIDMDTGDVVWRAGPSILSREQWEAGETLQPDRGPAPLDFVNDPRGGFSAQHGGHMTAAGNLLVYDNAGYCGVPPGVPEEAKGLAGCNERTRAVEYAIDIPNKELIFQREYLMPQTDPPRTKRKGGPGGHAEPLDNGDWVISWSNTMRAETQAPMPNTAMHVDAETGTAKLTMTLQNNNGVTNSIRGVMVSPVALAPRGEPLEATIASRREFHTGSTDRPTVVVAFNRPVVDFDHTTPSLNVAGATASSVTLHVAAGEAANAYVVTLTPAGSGDITVGLVADQPCADGGICTADGTVLSEVPASFVILADTTPPEVSKIEITSNPGSDRTYIPGEEIQATVTFSETVEVTGTPQLTLELGGGTRTAAYEGGSGTAALVFAYEVAEGESDTDGVGVEADSVSPNGGAIQDIAGNPAVLDHQAVAADANHKVDGVKPALASTGGAVVNGTTLTLTYDEPLERSSTPVVGDFTVSGGDQTRRVTRVSVSGSTVVLTLDVGAEHLEAGIQVSYTPGTSKIRDVPGNEAEALSGEPVTNETPDTTSPEVSSLEITSNSGADQTYALEDGIEVTVRFSEMVEVEGTPRLTLRVGTRTRTAGYESGTGTAALVFAYEVLLGDEDSDGVSIEAGRIALNGGSIEDEGENAAELAHEALAADADHRVDGVRPAFVSAAVDGDALTLTYGEALDGGSEPALGDFTVTVGGSGRTVSDVSVSGSVVTLTLNPEVEHGDTGIEVSYTPGTSPIQDEAGNDAQALSNRSATNTTAAPNTAPQITTGGTLSVGENQLLVRRLAARDTDAGDEVTGWAIVGGADQGQFSITSDTGDLGFRDAPDYENPVDVASADPVSGAADNEYVVTVEVTSGAGGRELTAEQTFIVRVTDEREAPEIPEAPVIFGETEDSLTVSWSEPDNTGPAITDYDVQYREKGRGGFTGVTHDGPGLSTTLSDLDPGTDYEVQVRAKNDEGTSGWSASGEGMTVTPLTVEMTAMEESPVSGPFSVRISFSEPVTGFSTGDIEDAQDPECMDDLNNPIGCDPVIGGLQTADNRIFTTTVTPQTSGVAHSYTLTLTVPAGRVNSSVGNKPNEEPEAPLEVRVSPPEAPESISTLSLAANGRHQSVRLSWNRPSENGGSPIIRYEYRYQAVGDAWSGWESVGAGSSGVTVGGLINGVEYVFEVRGVNALGYGGVETAMATPMAGAGGGGGFGGGGGGGGGGLLFPPEAPAALTAVAGDGMVRLAWSPPENDGGSPIQRYEYRLKEGRGDFGEWTAIPDSAVDEANALGYTVGELLKGTVCAFELRGVNAAGNGRVSEPVEVTMPLDPAWWSNFRAEDLGGGELMLEAFILEGSSRDRQLRFGEGLRFEEDELDGEGEVTATDSGSYGYRYTSRTTGELGLNFDDGEDCQVRLTFSGEGTGSYSYRCGGSSRGQGSFELSELENRVPEITSTGPFEVEENRKRVGQVEAVDWDEEDEVTGYGIAGGADEALFAIEVETGELSFKEAPDYEDPGDMESTDPESGAADNEYILVVEVTSGEGERERTREQAIRVRITDVEMEEAGEEEEETESLFVPVILTSTGRNNSFFTSELTLTNRGDEAVTLNYTYTSRDDPEERSGRASDRLPAGRQQIRSNALDYLRGLGVPIPETGNQVGTLRVEAPLGSEVRTVVRTTTVVPDGRAGLAYLGIAEEEGFDEPVYLCGLRQNSQDRSNLAFQNMGAPGEGAITIRTTVYSGESSDTSPRELEDIRLEPGGFHQYNQVLNVLGSDANGYVKVERVEGEAPFYAYGVINDQANSDGSFIFPVTASSLEGKMGQILPVIVETRDFTSELTVTNFSEEPRVLDFQFVAEGIDTDDRTASFSMKLEAGQQEIVPDVIEELRRQVAGLGNGNRTLAGSVFVTAKEGDLSGVVIGARTGSKGGGGQYGVFYNAVPEGEGFVKEAWVDGLQQNAENRSNLALVNMGEVDGSESVFHLEIYDGETGMLVETVVTKPVPARSWHQINGILGRASAETRQGYIRIEKMSGENPFLAYGVVNDGGSPGERSGDGAYLPARE